MAPTFHPRLLNGSEGDPAVLVRTRWSGRRFLLDLGDLVNLSPREALRISDVLVSHTHMDHFIGFDRLLRLHLGQPTRLRLWGPPGFRDQVASRLAGYTWNLVGDYSFVLEAWELGEDGLQGCRFRARAAFAAESLPPRRAPEGLLFEEETLRVSAGFLDHGTPVLAFRLEERERLNVDGDAVGRAGLVPGPWLGELKRRVRAGEDAARTLDCRTSDGCTVTRTLGEAAGEFLLRAEGQVLAYVTDMGWEPGNVARARELARNADPLLCEATFRESEAREAAARHHLTARQAGALAREAEARSLVLFHLSPRYAESPEEHLDEAREVYQGPVRLG